MNLDIEHMVHMNNNYLVVFIPSEDRKESHAKVKGFPREGNFEVRHRKWDTVEYISDSLVLALSMAEHMDRVLNKRLYLNELDGTDLIYADQVKDDEDEEEGGLLQ